MKLLNAFSVGMLKSVPGKCTSVMVLEITLERAREMVGVIVEKDEQLESCVGHADTAAIFGQQLGILVPMNRTTVVLNAAFEQCLLGQYSGPRLPEGTTVLPAGAAIRWFLVTVSKPSQETGRHEDDDSSAGEEWKQGGAV